MHRRRYSFLNLNNVLSVNYFGFYNGLITSDAMAEFSDLFYSSINKNNTLIAVYLDISRTFDDDVDCP